MIARIIIGILAAYLLIAYYPLILRVLPYLLPIALTVAAFWCLRAVPSLAEPLGYGILIVLLCYLVYLFLRRRDKLKEIIKNTKQRKINLPIVEIPLHPQLSILTTLVLYTVGLTFAIYLIILLIYVK